VDDDDDQMRTNIHALSGIRSHGFSVQESKAYPSHCAAAGTGVKKVDTSLGGLSSIPTFRKVRYTFVKIYHTYRLQPFLSHLFFKKLSWLRGLPHKE
jgi:hypothetical protein